MGSRKALLTNPKFVLSGIIIASVLLRAAAAIYLGNTIDDLPGIADQISYHTLASRVLGGYGFSFGEAWWPATAANAPTAHWSFLYTFYLTAVYALFGVHPIAARLIQVVITGVLMPWLTYRIARRALPDNQQNHQSPLPFSEQGALMSAAIVAVYLYFIYYAAALITESFYIVAILWAFDTAFQITQSEENGWRRWGVLGAALGTAVLLRQLFLLFIPFLLLWLWWVKRPSAVRLMIPVITIVMMILPFTLRNYIVFNQIVPLNTNAGYAFYWGNHPIYGTKFIPILPAEMGSYYSLLPPELLEQGLNEAELDSALLRRGLAFVIDDPVRYVLLSGSRIPAYFIFWPSSQSGIISNLSRVASFGLFLPAMLYGVYLSWRQRFPSWRDRLASPLTLLYLFALIYTSIHLLTWSLIRYRLPVDAVLIIFAGWALIDRVVRIRRREAARLRST